MIDSVYLELFRGMVFVNVFSVKIKRELKEKMEK